MPQHDPLHTSRGNELGLPRRLCPPQPHGTRPPPPALAPPCMETDSSDPVCSRGSQQPDSRPLKPLRNGRASVPGHSRLESWVWAPVDRLVPASSGSSCTDRRSLASSPAPRGTIARTRGRQKGRVMRSRILAITGVHRRATSRVAAYPGSAGLRRGTDRSVSRWPVRGLRTWRVYSEEVLRFARRLVLPGRTSAVHAALERTAGAG